MSGISCWYRGLIGWTEWDCVIHVTTMIGLTCTVSLCVCVTHIHAFCNMFLQVENVLRLKNKTTRALGTFLLFETHFIFLDTKGEELWVRALMRYCIS